MAAQAGLAVGVGLVRTVDHRLVSVGKDDYSAALRCNGAMFAVTSFAGQWLLPTTIAC